MRDRAEIAQAMGTDVASIENDVLSHINEKALSITSNGGHMEAMLSETARPVFLALIWEILTDAYEAGRVRREE